MANNLVRFNPFGELSRFDALRDFDDLFRNFRLGALSDAAAPQLKIDVSEDQNKYFVKADVPGARKEDIKVTIDGNSVSIRVETKRETEEKEGETVVHRERYYGVQSRNFLLSQEIDDAQATASYQDGVLTLELPKKAAGSGARVLDIG